MKKLPFLIFLTASGCSLLHAEKPSIKAVASEAKPHTPKIGTPERKAILDVLRAAVAADQKREDPKHAYAPAVLTPLHFRVLGQWAFVDATMKPDYAENSISAVLQLVAGKWQVKHLSLADDVTHYDKLAKKLAVPRNVFPPQPKFEP